MSKLEVFVFIVMLYRYTSRGKAKARRMKKGRGEERRVGYLTHWWKVKWLAAHWSYIERVLWAVTHIGNLPSVCN
jgi:hypothetical protein